MALRTLKQVKNLAGKRVLVREDFNVPMKGKKILDDSRIRASVPTIEYLLERGAKVIVATHIGRPNGKPAASLRVAPVAERLKKILNERTNIKNITRLKILEIGEASFLKSKREIERMENGEIVMLENIRFYPGEEKNELVFAKRLAGMADMFVLDGFAVAHREAASVSGVAKYLPSYAGLLLTRETEGLDRVMKKPKKPFVVILGGAKTETKAPVAKYLLPKASSLLLGGALVNTYLLARGYGIGASLADPKEKKAALALGRNKKTVMPVDLIVGTRNGKKYRHVFLASHPHEICKKREEILDIGPATARLYAGYIKKAKTVVWNGAMGYFEQVPYHHGTFAVARLVASRAKGAAFCVAGGGETLQALEAVRMSDHMDLASTGGGAMLEYLAGKKLPGVKAIGKD